MLPSHIEEQKYWKILLTMAEVCKQPGAMAIHLSYCYGDSSKSDHRVPLRLEFLKLHSLKVQLYYFNRVLPSLDLTDNHLGISLVIQK